MARILLTGATGFVGSSLAKCLANKNEVITVVRDKPSDTGFYSIAVGDFNKHTDFSSALSDIDIVIHLAAKAHVTSENITNPLEEFRKINVEATLKIAKQSLAAGVKRFIFISSIGVNGKSNSAPFKHSHIPNPTEDYSISKYEAEVGLKKIALGTSMETVIIRPPLVYGKDAPGNFGTLLKVVNANMFLPLGAINNQRSFISVDNLNDIILTCVHHPQAANQTFLVSDDEDTSTSQFLKKLTLASGQKPKLLPIPVSFLKFLASIVGKKAMVERFSSSLTVDIEHTKRTLNWTPPISLDEGIRRCFE